MGVSKLRETSVKINKRAESSNILDAFRKHRVPFVSRRHYDVHTDIALTLSVREPHLPLCKQVVNRRLA